MTARSNVTRYGYTLAALNVGLDNPILGVGQSYVGSFISQKLIESGNINGELRYSDDESDRKSWASETGKLKRFITAYVPFIENVKCTDGHGSKYDNK